MSPTDRARAALRRGRSALADAAKANAYLYRAAVALDVLRGAIPIGRDGKPQGRRSFHKGAAVNNYTADWRARNAGPNAVTEADLPTLRARSRDLVRSNAHARSAVAKLATRAIGCGIVPKCVTGKKALDKQVNALWKRWARQAAIDTDLTVYGLQELAFRAMLESGEALIRRRRRRPEDASAGKPLEVLLQLQLLESDHIDPYKTEDIQSKDGKPAGRVVQGIEYDVVDRRAAYWLYPRHPGETGSFSLGSAVTSERIPAESIAHLFQPLRPGQARGLPMLAPVMRTLRDIDDYGDTELVRQKMAACLMALVTTEDVTTPPATTATEIGAPNGDAESTIVADANGNPIDRLEPGMIALLRGGKQVQMTTPQTNAGYPEYVASQLQRIAAGIGLPYEILTADLSRVNYSSYRAGSLEFRAMIEALQENVIVPLLCDPLWTWFIAAAVAQGIIPERDYPVEWVPPRYEDIDRVKEATADMLEMRCGTASRPGIIARKGYDALQVTQEITDDLADIDARGIVLDSDPRKTAVSGTAQDYLREREGIETGARPTKLEKKGASTAQADEAARAIMASALRSAEEGDEETAATLSGAAIALALPRRIAAVQS